MGNCIEKIFGGDPLQAPSDAAASSVHDCAKYVCNKSDCQAKSCCCEIECHTSEVSDDE